MFTGKLDGVIMTENKLLKTMLDEMKKINSKLDDIQEDTKVTRAAVNSLIEWADDVGVITSVKYPIKKAE